MNLTTRGPLYTCLVLLIAANQYEELVGQCNKEDGFGVGDADSVQILSVENKENCLKQCILKEGAKGCMWLNFSTSCYAVMKTVVASNKIDIATCWRFIADKGKSQY